MLPRGVAAQPRHAPSHGNLGNVLAAQGRLDEAIEQYKIVLRLKPLDVKAHERIGETLALQGEFAEAEGYFREALRRNPTSPTAYRNLAVRFNSRARPRRPSCNMPSVCSCSLTTPRCCLPRLAVRDAPFGEVSRWARGGELARRAVALSQGHEAWYFKMLAAAYAEAGRMDDAKTTLRQAMARRKIARSGPRGLDERTPRPVSSGRPYRDADLTNGRLKGKD